jgi:hypothetical protein
VTVKQYAEGLTAGRISSESARRLVYARRTPPPGIYSARRASPLGLTQHSGPSQPGPVPNAVALAGEQLSRLTPGY